MVDPNWMRHVLRQNPLWEKLATYKEVPIVSELLLPGDQILDVAFGLYEDHLGLVVLTPSRVLFGGRKPVSLLKHTKAEVFDLQKITAVQVNASAVLSTLIIVTSGAKGEIRSMASIDCKRIADGIRSLITHQSVSASPPHFQMAATPPPAPTISFADELNKLSQLHASGALSDNEFVQAKAKLLN